MCTLCVSLCVGQLVGIRGEVALTNKLSFMDFYWFLFVFVFVYIFVFGFAFQFSLCTVVSWLGLEGKWR